MISDRDLRGGVSGISSAKTAEDKSAASSDKVRQGSVGGSDEIVLVLS